MIKRRRLGLGLADTARLGSQLLPGMRELLLDCLQADPERRPASAAEVESRLRLCLHPDAQRLLTPRSRSWQQLALRWPTASIVLVPLLVNAAGAAFNTAYNLAEVVPSGAEAPFWRVQIIINGIAFPIGIAVLVVLASPLRRSLSGKASDQPARGDQNQQARLRTLAMGHLVAVVGIVEWIIAGMLYPALMHWAGAPLAAHHYLHFMVSLTLCGMIAATYPFFGVTALAVREFYPRLLPAEPPGEPDAARLAQLSRRTWGYLILAASLPMLAVVVLVLIGSERGRLALGILGAGSLLGFGLIFYLARAIQVDLATLSWLVQPKSDEAAETGSFLTSSGRV
jgi:hypothetical protein